MLMIVADIDLPPVLSVEDLWLLPSLTDCCKVTPVSRRKEESGVAADRQGPERAWDQSAAQWAVACDLGSQCDGARLT
jgi:hypothetical protein